MKTPYNNQAASGRRLGPAFAGGDRFVWIANIRRPGCAKSSRS